MVFESAVIGEYLDERFPDPPLMPTRPFERAQARLWTDFVTAHLVPPLTRVRKSSQPEKVRRSWPEFRARLSILDERLRGQRWLAGAYFSLADINATPFIERAAGMEAGTLLRDYPALEGWFAAIRARAGYQATEVADW